MKWIPRVKTGLAAAAPADVLSVVSGLIYWPRQLICEAGADDSVSPHPLSAPQQPSQRCRRRDSASVAVIGGVCVCVCVTNDLSTYTEYTVNIHIYIFLFHFIFL